MNCKCGQWLNISDGNLCPSCRDEKRLKSSQQEARVAKLVAALRVIAGDECRHHPDEEEKCADFSTDKVFWCSYCIVREALREFEEEG